MLLEAMALGTPVVSTAVMGTRTVLEDAPGAVVADEDVAAFAAAASYLLLDRTRLAALGAVAARDIAGRWSGPEMARRLLSLYHRVAAKASAKPRGNLRVL